MVDFPHGPSPFWSPCYIGTVCQRQYSPRTQASAPLHIMLSTENTELISWLQSLHSKHANSLSSHHHIGNGSAALTVKRCEPVPCFLNFRFPDMHIGLIACKTVVYLSLKEWKKMEDKTDKVFLHLAVHSSLVCCFFVISLIHEW